MSTVVAGGDLWLPQTASMIKFREIRTKIAQLLEICSSQGHSGFAERCICDVAVD